MHKGKVEIPTRDEYEELLMRKSADWEYGDIIAAGYETGCPKCGELLSLIEIPAGDEAVRCPVCKHLFLTGPPEHAYG